jgi:hypothetical protein
MEAPSKNPKLIVICGLQGTGKTTVARMIIKKFKKGVLLRTDKIRRKLFKEPKYTEEEMQKVYDEMLLETKKAIKEGKVVVLDATFARAKNRKKVELIAKESNVELTIIEVKCKEEVVRERIKRRKGDASRAGYNQYLQYKKIFDPIKEEHIIIDNSGSFDDLKSQIKKIFENQKA